MEDVMIKSFRDSLDIENTPVQVVRKLTSGWDVLWFENLAAAKAVFPTLDPYHNTKDFTWSVRGETSDGRTALRFENWDAERTLSI